MNEDDEIKQELHPAVEEQIRERKEESLIDDAKIAARRLEDANKRMSELLDRQERLMVRNTLGGKTEAGNSEPKEESPKDYAAKVMRGEL